MKPLLLLRLLSSLAYGQADSTQTQTPSQMIVVGEGITPATDVLGAKYGPLDPADHYGPYVNPLASENARLKADNNNLMNSHALRWTTLILITLASFLAGQGN